MKEDLLQYIWKQKLIPLKNMVTTNGESLQVIHAGRFNTDGGPDFLEAKVRIGDTLLAGSVEIHVRSSDWKAHGHGSDRKYSNVILHVVYFHDDPSAILPTLELNGKIPPLLLQKYRQLMSSGEMIPCSPFWKEVENIQLESFKERLVVERLENRCAHMMGLLDRNKQDWLLAIYRLTGKYFGGPVNQHAWEALTERIDYRVLLKHADDVFQLEALLFGVAGFLREPADEYALRLQKEYLHLQAKYGLKEIPLHYWNFLRIRPAAFPTIRLALFAQLIHRMPQFSGLTDIVKARQILEKLRASAYWEQHYVFGRRVKSSPRKLGKSAVDSMLVNVCIPLQYTYARFIQQPALMLSALEELYALPAEENRITRKYSELLDATSSAYDSQAVLQLYQQYCTPRRCLYCRIGHSILQGNIRLKDKFSEPGEELLI